MSIQYPVPGFEITIFWLWVSSFNHKTRAHALYCWSFNFKLACLNYLSLTAYCLLHKLTFHVGIFGKQIDIRSTRNDFIGINIHLYSLRQNPHVLWSFLFFSFELCLFLSVNLINGLEVELHHGLVMRHLLAESICPLL